MPRERDEYGRTLMGVNAMQPPDREARAAQKDT